eukprot:EG_transcript_17883
MPSLRQKHGIREVSSLISKCPQRSFSAQKQFFRAQEARKTTFRAIFFRLFFTRSSPKVHGFQAKKTGAPGEQSYRDITWQTGQPTPKAVPRPPEDGQSEDPEGVAPPRGSLLPPRAFFFVGTHIRHTRKHTHTRARVPAVPAFPVALLPLLASLLHRPTSGEMEQNTEIFYAINSLPSSPPRTPNSVFFHAREKLLWKRATVSFNSICVGKSTESA